MVTSRRVILGVVTLVVCISMGVVSVSGWDLWDLARWTSSTENYSASPRDGLGGTSAVPPEDGQASDGVHPTGSTRNPLQDVVSGDFGNIYPLTTVVSNSSAEVPVNDSFHGSDEEGVVPKEGDVESKGFTHQLLQKTIDFFSNLLSPSHHESVGTDEGFNLTEIDNVNSLESDLCRDGNTLANCSSDSVTPEQQPNDGSLEPLDGDYPETKDTTAPTDTSLVEEPTWIDACAPCLRQSIGRSVGKCTLGEEERTLEGALVEVFNDDIVKRLAKKCSPGEWCLRKHFSRQQMQAVQRSCQLLNCFADWRDDNDCPPSNFVWNALHLLCSLTSNKSDDCVISALKMIHVTITDMIRVTVQPEDEELLCSKDEDKEGCRGPCQKSGQSLRCMSTNCNNDTVLFENLAEWQWLFGKSVSVEKCPFNSSDCRLFDPHFMVASHDTVMPHHGPRHLLKFLKNNEWSVMAGLVISVLFSLVVVCGIFLGLRCSGRRRLRQRMLRHKAMARDDGGGVGGGGLARDRIQYTIITTQQDDFYDQDSDDMT